MKNIIWMGEHDRVLFVCLLWLILKFYNFFLTKLINLNLLEKIYAYIYVHIEMCIYLYVRFLWKFLLKDFIQLVVVQFQSHVWLFCEPVDSSVPSSSVHGISQARIQERSAIPSPGDLPNPGIEPTSPALAYRFFTTEPPFFHKKQHLLGQSFSYGVMKFAGIWEFKSTHTHINSFARV